MKLIKMHIIFVSILLKCNFDQKQRSIFLGSLDPFKWAFNAFILSDYSNISQATRNAVCIFSAIQSS